MTFTLLMAGPALAEAGEPICQRPLDLRVFEVPITTCSGGVMLTTTTTSWAVVTPDQRALDTLSLARALGDAGVDGEGGDRAVVVGATLLSLGGTGLIFGPTWLGLRPWALKNNPAAFYPLDEVREKLEFYDDACRS